MLLPDISTKLVFDIEIPKGEIKKSLLWQEIDLTDSLGQKIKVWKKIWKDKLLCTWKIGRKKVQYVFEIENITGNNTVVWAINKWMFAKQLIAKKENADKEFHFSEAAYYSNPRLYDIRFNHELFKLNLRVAKLVEMGRDLLQEKKKQVKRNGKIHTVLRSKGFVDRLYQFSYEKTLETDQEVADKLLDEIVNMCVETEIRPPKPIEPPFFFRTAQIVEIWEHFIKLCKQRGKEDDDLLSLDALNDFLDDDFEEVVTRSEVEEIKAKMKRKIRKIARQFWKKQNPDD